MGTLTLTYEDCEAAFREWGCNCGPAVLAVCLGLPLDDVRVPCEAAGFAAKRYMSPTMMQNAVAVLGAKIIERKQLPLDKRIACDADYFIDQGIVRVQWCGPWTKPGSNPKWAYGATHWIATFADGAFWRVFDVNAGLQSFEEWESFTVPKIIETIKRADGEWYVTHAWKLSSTTTPPRKARP